ncbi:MAG: hypothetical protein PHC65_05675 [Methanobacteriaceae archaeon]|nr:hypothetical protein [Methanobacteriaceae archaeon]MDD4594388.1 hypothetical protein [Methanobacteriaceae archaeon]
MISSIELVLESTVPVSLMLSSADTAPISKNTNSTSSVILIKGFFL